MAERRFGPGHQALRRFCANRAAVAAAAVLVLLLVTALAAPWLAPTGYNDQVYLDQAFAFPSAAHWFGVDPLGRDFLSRVLYGARVSLGVGFFSALVSLVVGLPLGALAGYRGGKTDWLVMRLVELFSVVPPLLLAIVLATFVGGGVANVVLISSGFIWVGACRMVRGQVMAYKSREFVTAARALGASSGYVLRRHLVPNSVSPVIVGFVLTVPQAMMIEASLSFLGVGINPPTPSWGQMISSGLEYLFYFWHLCLFPTVFLAITVLATTLFADGLRDAVDPTLKGQ